MVALLLGALTGCGLFKRSPPQAKPAALVERLEITSRKAAFGGATFGEAGAYELLTGVATVRIDPSHPANRDIVDLKLAAEKDGLARYSTDVVILRPAIASRASGVLLFEAANRGRKLALGALNDGAAQAEAANDAGHGWIMRSGHTMVWIGWQGDIPLGSDGRSIGTRLPVLGTERRPVTGQSVEEFVFDNNDRINRVGLTYPAMSQDQRRATLRVRQRPEAPPTLVPPGGWRFVNEREIEISRASGFDGGAIYQFTYEARDPVVMGLGFAATRDLATFLKGASVDGSGQPHPLADLRPTVSVAVGVSQSGRFLRDFVWQGFNSSAEGGRVFDAMMVVVAGSRKSFTNARWAQPGRYSRQHEDHWFPGDQFPFTYGMTTDPVSSRKDGIFAKCSLNGTCPKTMHVDSTLEYWQARASLITTDGAGRDVKLPDEVRAYLMASTQHVTSVRPEAGICEQLSNPAQQTPTMRALLSRLIEWSRDGKAPPPSSVPTVADGTLVPPSRDAVGFPDLAQLGVEFPRVINELTVVDYSKMPGKVDKKRSYKVLVPRTDKDGNDIAGIRQPDIQVPLGTHTGWNTRREGFAPGQLCGLAGSFVPLANDPVARLASNDPRASIAERYPSRLHYVERMQSAAELLKLDGLMLDEDVGRWVDRARLQAQQMLLRR